MFTWASGYYETDRHLILGIRCISQVKSPHTVCACHHDYITLASVSIIGSVNLTRIITLVIECSDGMKVVLEMATSGIFGLAHQTLFFLMYLQVDMGLPCVTFFGNARVCLTGW